MTRLPREPHHRGGQARHNNYPQDKMKPGPRFDATNSHYTGPVCYICAEHVPDNEFGKTYVYLQKHDAIALVGSCDMHFNPNICGTEREEIKGYFK